MTLAEELRKSEIFIKNEIEEKLLLDAIRKLLSNRAKEGYKDYQLTESTLDYFFQNALKMEMSNDDKIGNRRFFQLLKSFNKVLINEGFIVECIMEPYITLVFTIKW